jgi:hypothetical protein
MNDFPLLPELEKLESELIFRSTRPAGEQFRRQIASSVHKSLKREQQLDFWRFASAAALVAGVWLNLSLCAASVTDFHFQLADKGRSMEQIARQIRDLAPILSEENARSEAAILCSGGYLPVYPNIPFPAATTNRAPISDYLMP